MPTIVCPMCATEFDPRRNQACSSCPLGAGCHLACCPECGYTTVDPAASRLAGWMDRALRRRGRRRHARRRSRYVGYGSLGQVTPGWSAVVSNLTRLPPGKRRRLEALGLTVGEAVEVIAQSPVTVIRAGHAQLALSAEISRLIEVETEDGR